MKPRTKKRPSKREQQVSKAVPGEFNFTVRMPAELIERLEALVPVLARDVRITTLTGQVSRSTVLRIAVLRGVESLESEYKMQK